MMIDLHSSSVPARSEFPPVFDLIGRLTALSRRRFYGTEERITITLSELDHAVKRLWCGVVRPGRGVIVGIGAVQQQKDKRDSE